MNVLGIVMSDNIQMEQSSQIQAATLLTRSHLDQPVSILKNIVSRYQVAVLSFHEVCLLANRHSGSERKG